ncbi:uncharacterized protein N7498_001155 [Penicillium cinerascens]|uniref:Uncharacterized protein n=1 Tax=Penicillium cinerascens TaxID=70096 RepID=A0A9W9NFU3_9EURO|nr:uncharacterized protein N7498_001155 [Penicillium cinerascens]KAJ5219056.1 hypothetical protein N7498_001155 [Penicillium cinerascens]
MEAWKRSADTWVQSKTRCRRSTANILNRSASKLHETSERFYRHSLPPERMCDENKEEVTPELDETTASTSPTQYSQHSPSPKSPQHSQSPRSLPQTETDSVEPKHASINIPETTQKTPEKQLLQLLNQTDQVVYKASQARRLRNSQAESLGEIEHSWISSTISDADNAARDLTKLLEPYRLDMVRHKGKMKGANRKRWSLEDSQLARERLSGLTLFQSRLDRAVDHLKGVISHPESPQAIDSDIVSELPTETRENTPPYVELPCEPSSFESQSATIIAELSENTPINFGSPTPLPKIIVTQPPDEIMLEHTESPDEGQANHESHEMDEALYWDQTRNSIQIQQSESFSNIIAKMELTRVE